MRLLSIGLFWGILSGIYISTMMTIVCHILKIAIFITPRSINAGWVVATLATIVICTYVCMVLMHRSAGVYVQQKNFVQDRDSHIQMFLENTKTRETQW